jgi:SOS response associated peptidase (SRAP)
MCGRYTQLRSWSDLVRLYRITANQTSLNLPPRYNIAPAQDVPVVRCAREDGGRELVLMRWGLVPFWAKDVAVGYKTINARAETIAEKPAFRTPSGSAAASSSPTASTNGLRCQPVGSSRISSASQAISHLPSRVSGKTGTVPMAKGSRVARSPSPERTRCFDRSMTACRPSSLPIISTHG